MRDRLIKKVLEMVEETEDIRSLNLRQLAKRVGCAHTNIYNYFSSMEDLLWHAVIPAIDQISAATVDVILNMTFPSEEDRIRALFQKQVAYALSHEGIYRFVWLEKPPVTSTPPDGFVEKLKENWFKFLDCLFAENSSLCTKDRFRIGSVLSSYLHGEICNLIFHRTMSGNRDKAIHHLIDNAVQLFRLLVNQAKAC